MEPLLLEVDGMFCTSCARAAERVLSRVPGVSSARVGFATRVASLEVDAGADRAEVERRAIAAATELGYPARPWVFRPAGLGDADDEATAALWVRIAIGWFLGMWVMIAQVALYVDPGMAPEARTLLARASAALATPVALVVGARFHLAAWRTLRAGVPGMDLLVSIGSLGAWALSLAELGRGGTDVWFDASVMLVVLLLAGRLLEARARERGVNAVRELLDLTPEVVRLWSEEGVREVIAATVEPGAVIEVPAHARIPLDGTVTVGRSTLDRAVLTGESAPLRVGPGDEVEAGCTNGSGTLLVQVSAGVGQRVLDRIATQVRTALDQRAEVPGFAERLSEHLAPAVLVLAALTLVGTSLWTGSLEAGLLRALTVTVVTCPCALGVAAPLVRVVAVGRAASRGLLFRDTQALERAASVDLVVLDKTGTLTEGRPAVVAVEPVAGVGGGELLSLAASAEVGAEHPLARALIAATDRVERGGERTVEPGRGVRWVHGTREVRVGSRAWIQWAPSESTEGTEVLVERDGVVLGRVVLADAVRGDAAATVTRLRAAGYALALWSGDAPGPVASVASAVGLRPDEVRSGLSPLDKADAVAAAEAAGQRVAFVGDGVNDAPALARATVGIAVDGASDAARAAAGIVVRAQGLPRVAAALALAGHAARRSRWNVGWALLYNAVAVPLAVAGLVTPQVAAVAMALSSLSVTLGAVRRWPSWGVEGVQPMDAGDGAGGLHAPQGLAVGAELDHGGLRGPAREQVVGA
ncbi:MAG: cadmium-translocating P-type ATPase [Alphaproteobacteria bacterium]|nr:cadmium-translocating P-type ATPase [Alphaproteobacteria bacterium]